MIAFQTKLLLVIKLYPVSLAISHVTLSLCLSFLSQFTNTRSTTSGYHLPVYLYRLPQSGFSCYVLLKKALFRKRFKYNCMFLQGQSRPEPFIKMRQTSLLITRLLFSCSVLHCRRVICMR